MHSSWDFEKPLTVGYCDGKQNNMNAPQSRSTMKTKPKSKLFLQILNKQQLIIDQKSRIKWTTIET